MAPLNSANEGLKKELAHEEAPDNTIPTGMDATVKSQSKERVSVQASPVLAAEP